MEQKEIGTFIKESLNDNWLKWCLRIISVLLILVFIWGWSDYRLDIAQNKHAKFLWWERNIPKGYPDTVYIAQTRIVVDTFYSPPKNLNIKSLPSPKNVQKNDSGGSGIQNNAPNFGNQAGRDININGKVYRHPEQTLISQIADSIPNKNTQIVFAYVNDEDEAKHFCHELRDILQKQGYSNITFFNQGVYGSVVPVGITLSRQSDGSIFIRFVLN